jgi:hypothetical protein
MAGSSTIRGLVINGTGGNGIEIVGSANIIEGNYIGTDASGTSAAANLANGIEINQTATSNTIGGTTAAARNVISGNVGHGVFLNDVGSANVIQGNYIGTDASGSLDIGNTLSGVRIEVGTANTVGGAAPLAGNVIAGNDNHGIHIVAFELADTDGNFVQGNIIGLDESGAIDRGNTNSGIFLEGVSSTTIGGTTATVRNVISGNDRFGVRIEDGAFTPDDAELNVIQGNYIGTDVTGTVDLGNSREGVLIVDAASNTVGGTAPGARNIISGNDRSGIRIDSVGATPADVDGNAVLGNYVGTDVTGTVALGNEHNGVRIRDVHGNSVGGIDAGGRNVISGNALVGITIWGVSSPINTAAFNEVQGNYIGTDVTGTVALGNGFDGVRIREHAESNTVGGTVAEARNVISGNAANGVMITSFGSSPNGTTLNEVQGNYIGTDVTGTVALGNGFDGVLIQEAQANTVGGSNVISGNGNSGVLIRSLTGSPADASGNVVKGNYIGTDVTGTIALGNVWRGVTIADAQSNTIGGTTTAERNVISGNEQSGVLIWSLSSTPDLTRLNIVEGNYIGTDVTGTREIGNDVGVFVQDAESNTVGGTSAGARNIVSGNDLVGVVILASIGIPAETRFNLVQGNYIGTDVDGTAALGNGLYGVGILDATSNTVGGTSAAARNVISGNGIDGVRISNFLQGLPEETELNVVQGNYIGTDAGGTMDLGNGFAGVLIRNSNDNTIGGTAPGADNVIAFNASSGVAVLEQGSTPAGSAPSTGNAILTNSIFGNRGLGIDLELDQVTANDLGDGDGSPNMLQNFPVLSSFSVGAQDTTVGGSLNSTPSTTFRIEFYTGNFCDSSVFGQGREFLGSTSVLTDPMGEVSFLPTFSNTTPPGTFVTATATDPSDNTSEFSGCFPTPPTVVLVVPEDDATDVPVGTNVTLVFSEPLDPPTVTPIHVKLLGPGGVPVPAEVGLTPSGTTVTLDPQPLPTGMLATSTIYTVVVTSGLLDAGGSAAAPFSSKFRTEDVISGGVLLPSLSTQAYLPPPPSPSLAAPGPGFSAVPTGAGAVTGDNLGVSAAFGGDLNDDGLDDSIAGAPGYAFGDTETGAVGLFFGSADDEQRREPDIVFLGENASDQVGFAVAGSFFFNDDSVPDILIGAPGANGGAGRVYLIFFDPNEYTGLGSGTVFVDLAEVADTDGKNDISGIVFDGANVGDLAGFAVAGGGQLATGSSRDDQDDIVIGAPGADLNAGRFYVVFNDPALIGPVDLGTVGMGTVLGRAYHGSAGEGLGSSLALPGDVTGDAGEPGPDVAIGAPTATTSQFEAGKVYVLAGGNLGDGPPLNADITNIPTQILGDQTCEHLGFSVAGGGDNRAFAPGAPGGLDLLIGAPDYDTDVSTGNPCEGTTPEADTGRVIQTSSHLRNTAINVDQIGNASDASPINGVIWVGEQPGGKLGWSVANLGDVTGNTLEDIGLGSPFLNSATAGAGGIYVIQAKAIDVTASEDLPGTINVVEIGQSVSGAKYFGEQENERQGAALARGGNLDDEDLNAEDFAVGAPGWSHCDGGVFQECTEDSDCPGNCQQDAGTVHQVIDTLPQCTSLGCIVVDLQTGAELEVPAGSIATGVAAKFKVRGLEDPREPAVACTLFWNDRSLGGITLVGVADYQVVDCSGGTCADPLADYAVEIPTYQEAEYQLTDGDMLPLRFCSSSFGWLEPVEATGTVKDNSYIGGRRAIEVSSPDGELRIFGAFILDADGDGARDDRCDCDNTDSSIWELPAVLDLMLSQAAAGVTTLAWSTPTGELYGGTTTGSTVVYDVLRSNDLNFEIEVTCLDSDITETEFTDSDEPASGQAYYYHVRGQNGCATDPMCFPSARAAADCPLP